MSSRRSALLAVILTCMMLLGLGFTVYFYSKWVDASCRLAYSTMQLQSLQSTVSMINMTAPRVSVTVNFTPVPPAKVVAPNTVTFLMGYVTVSNITGILYPATLCVNFTVYHLAPQSTRVRYNYIRMQTVYLAQGIDYVEIPWGIFPLEIRGTPGDQVLLTAVARVTITWAHVNAVMADQRAEATYVIVIGGEAGGRG